MRLPRAYEPGARDYRIRYAIANIMRDRIVNEGAFVNCFEMEDADEVVVAILRRGLKNPKLRAALEGSHIVNLTEWLTEHPEYSEGYHGTARKSRAIRPAMLFATDSCGTRRAGVL
jgi:hypothetical protein